MKIQHSMLELTTKLLRNAVLSLVCLTVNSLPSVTNLDLSINNADAYFQVKVAMRRLLWNKWCESVKQIS
jgi:hypothetical protein